MCRLSSQSDGLKKFVCSGNKQETAPLTKHHTNTNTKKWRRFPFMLKLIITEKHRTENNTQQWIDFSQENNHIKPMAFNNSRGITKTHKNISKYDSNQKQPIKSQSYGKQRQSQSKTNPLFRFERWKRERNLQRKKYRETRFWDF